MAKHVITGGPGVGKTTTLHELRSRGHQINQEAARAIIAHEQRKEIAHPAYTPAVPWTDLVAFQSYVVALQQRQEALIGPQTTYLDRGLPDTLAYASLGNIPLRSDTLDAILATDYNTVFILDPLSTYQTDAQRREDPETAKRIHEAIYTAYDRLGCRIITIPPVSVRERADIIEKHNASELREKEIKIRVESHEQILSRIASEGMHLEREGPERNTFYSALGMKQLGWTCRLRDHEGYTLTIKGPERGVGISDRFEYERIIPRWGYHTLRGALLPFHDLEYVKRRQTYRPMGDRRVHISLDTLLGIGNFVEIEAQDESQIARWKQRLGIHGEHVKDSYAKIVRSVRSVDANLEATNCACED